MKIDILSEPFKASMDGTCGACGLAIKAGQEIVKTNPIRERYASGFVARRSYCHHVCAVAWQQEPEPKETITCPDCEKPIEHRHLIDHLLHTSRDEEDRCSAYRIGASKLIAKLRYREAILRHAGLLKGQSL